MTVPIIRASKLCGFGPLCLPDRYCLGGVFFMSEAHLRTKISSGFRFFKGFWKRRLESFKFGQVTIHNTCTAYTAIISRSQVTAPPNSTLPSSCLQNRQRQRLVARCRTLRAPNFVISREGCSTTSKATLMCPLEVILVSTLNLSS